MTLDIWRGIFTGDKELGSTCGRREEPTCTEAEEAGDCSGQYGVPSGWTAGLRRQVQELWLERQAGTPAGLGSPSLPHGVWPPLQEEALDTCCLKRQQAPKSHLENAHKGMLRFLLFKLLSLPLPHLIYARTYEEVKASIYYKIVLLF